MKAGYIAIFMTMVAWLIVSAARFKPAPIVRITPELDIYERAELVTGAPAEILRAIAIVESNEGDNQVGDGGRSHGRFQINETYRDERVRKYGEYDPHDSLNISSEEAVMMVNTDVQAKEFISKSEFINKLDEDFGIDGLATMLFISRKLVDDNVAYIAVDDILEKLGKERDARGRYKKEDIKKVGEIIERILGFPGFKGARIR